MNERIEVNVKRVSEQLQCNIMLVKKECELQKFQTCDVVLKREREGRCVGWK